MIILIIFKVENFNVQSELDHHHHRISVCIMIMLTIYIFLCVFSLEEVDSARNHTQTHTQPLLSFFLCHVKKVYFCMRLIINIVFIIITSFSRPFLFEKRCFLSKKIDHVWLDLIAILRIKC